MSFLKRVELSDCETIVRSKSCPKVPVVVETGEDSKTQQHLKDSCDINVIAKNPDASSTPMHVQSARERYGDFSDMLDLAGNMQKSINAKYLFEALPTELRKKLGHSMENLFSFIADPSNKEDCIKYGIFDKPQEEKVSKVEITNPSILSDKKGNLKKSKVISEDSEE